MATALGATQLAPSCSEQELVAAVRRGDDRAFEVLYSRYRARIGAYIQRMVHDHARTEDIAQEVFISALRRLRDTERPIALKPWLYEIARNACIDEFRRTRRTHEVPLDPDPDDSGGSGPVIAGGTTPDSAVENKQRLNDLRGAFHGLSESHHRIIVMREFEGLSYDQIGHQLGMTKPVVESTLFRARRKLSQEYDELVSGRRCERVQSVIEAGGERPLLSLGLRERRQLARHLSHCQPCRRHARMAGVDESFFQTPSLIGKIAALLPIPAWLRFRRPRNDGDGIAAAGGVHSVAIQSAQVASRLADASSPVYGLGRATATAVAIVIAGAGGGLVTGIGGHGAVPVIRPAGGRVASPAAPPRTGAGVHRGHSGSFGSSKAGVSAPSGTGGRGGTTAKRGPRAGGGRGGAGGAGGSGGSGGSGGGAGSSSSASGGPGSPVSQVTAHGKSVIGGAGSPLGTVGAPVGGAAPNVTPPASNATTGASNAVGQTASNLTNGASNPVSQTASNVGQTASNVGQTASNVGQTASNVTNTASNAVGQTGSNVGQTASKVTNTASNAVGETASNVGQTASNVTNTASNVVNSVPKPQLPPAPSGNPPSAPKPPNTGGLLPSH